MKKILPVIGMLLLFSCGKRTETIVAQDGKDGKDGRSCTVTQSVDKAVISCDDGSEATVMNGQDCEVKEVSTGAEVTCGNNTVLITDGSDGADGEDGVDGSDGQDGADGQDGSLTNPHSIVNIIDPCPSVESDSGFKEILLQLYSGDIIAFFLQEGRGQSNVDRREFLAALPDGNYVTTDDRQCQFTVSDGSVTTNL